MIKLFTKCYYWKINLYKWPNKKTNTGWVSNTRPDLLCFICQRLCRIWCRLRPVHEHKLFNNPWSWRVRSRSLFTLCNSHWSPPFVLLLTGFHVATVVDRARPPIPVLTGRCLTSVSRRNRVHAITRHDSTTPYIQHSTVAATDDGQRRASSQNLAVGSFPRIGTSPPSTDELDDLRIWKKFLNKSKAFFSWKH